LTPTPLHTFTGRSLYLQAPTFDAIDIDDVARGLRQPRFVAQTEELYTVLEHSVHVSYLCEPEDAREGLLHDIAEAFLGDQSRPLRSIPGCFVLNALHAHLTAIGLQRFGLSGRIPESVRIADNLMCLHEAHELFPIPPSWSRPLEPPMYAPRLQPWSAEFARRRFLERYEELFQVGTGGGP